MKSNGERHRPGQQQVPWRTLICLLLIFLSAAAVWIANTGQVRKAAKEDHAVSQDAMGPAMVHDDPQPVETVPTTMEDTHDYALPAVVLEPAGSAGGVPTGKAMEIIAILEDTPVGQLTTEEAWEVIDNAQEIANELSPYVDRLLASSSVEDRLSGVFLYLELYGFDDYIFDAVAADVSFYVVAELAIWLHENAMPDERDILVGQVASRLSAEDVYILMAEIRQSPPHHPVSPVMSRLSVGEGLPLLVREIARYNMDLRQALIDKLMDKALSPTELQMILEILAFIQPPDYQSILKGRLSSFGMQNLADNLTVDHLAATAFADDLRTVQFVNNFMPKTPAGLTRNPVRYLDALLSEAYSLSGQIEKALDEYDLNHTMLSGLLSAYRYLAMITPHGVLDNEAPMSEIEKLETESRDRQLSRLIADVNQLTQGAPL